MERNSGAGADRGFRVAKDKIGSTRSTPGIIETPLAHDADGKPLVPVEKFAIPRNATTEEIAKYVLFVASEDAVFSTGSEFVADGGYALGPIR